ncbi:hypothetical protein P389DRAFT_174483 [Cystobasidium minutum MCA 4210]|uniref:uncharacterized protein n=1 Tax=Cystobasidium minutum MCA 4210 TaxID=1397322 RepID=UPI0034CFB88A|eukprot:jgi/Rhomi1/174483/fgenesh1_kg.8_\
MAQHGSVQGVMQVSVLCQFPAALLDQVSRRLASHAEHQYALHMVEDVFFRGIHDPTAPLRDEDVLRVRHTTLDKTDEWTINTFTRPLPVRENPDVLLRGISTVPVLEGDAQSLTVALGYSERRFANARKGLIFTLHDNLTSVQIYQLFTPPDAADPLDTATYVLEIASLTSQKPITSSVNATPMQALRDQAVGRVLELKRLLKGLVDVARVE